MADTEKIIASTECLRLRVWQLEHREREILSDLREVREDIKKAQFIKRERGNGFHEADSSDCEICRADHDVPPEFQWESASNGWRSPEEPIDGNWAE